jgi:hypothetical protein
VTGLEYVNSILRKYAADSSKADRYQKSLYPYIQSWAGKYLVDVKISGSSRKGTAVSSGTDVDLFVSLSSTTNNTLKEIYDSLFTFMKSKGFTARKQNVSIGVDFHSDQIDLVPAKRQSQYGNDHSLFVNKKGTWTKTNIETHISQVSNSGRLDEIKLMKIWRNANKLDFPSFYLELVVIDSLYNRNIGPTDRNFITALNFIAESLESKVYMDPANTNNCISDQITATEKKRIAQLAKNAASQEYWENIVS